MLCRWIESARARRSVVRASGESPRFFDYPALMQRADAQRAMHLAAGPFPHSTFDGIMPADAAQALSEAMPRSGGNAGWDFYFAKGFEDKWALSDDQKMPPLFRALVRELNSGAFIRFLERLSGIDHLLPDPHLLGAGLHMVPSGGVLQIHSDFNWSESLQAHRRVNLFIYLNVNWVDEWGGALELWDHDCAQMVQRIPCLFNRMVVFNARSDTFHGHPHPLTCPQDEWRKSIAMYYYTSARPADETHDPHNTIYKGLHF